MEKLLIIDGNSLINRAFYALPLLSNKSGEYSNAVYGFTNMLIKAINDHAPSHIVVAFDYGKKTFRHAMYDAYKAGRHETPNELKSQFPLLKHLLSAMNIKMYEKDGIEADDIIGTISKKCDKQTVILTGDKDCLQLIDDKIEVWLTKKGISEVALMNEKTLLKEYNLNPSQIIDLKALMGDASDNIPGVAGVGEKTASTLLQEYNTVDEVYKSIGAIKGKLQEKLITGKDNAYLSRELATINCNIDIKFKLDEFVYDFPFSEQVYEIFEEYNFNSLLRKPELFQSQKKYEAQNSTTNIIEISTLKNLEVILPRIKQAGVFAFDIGANLHFAYDKNCEYIVRLEGSLLDAHVELPEVLNCLKEILEDGRITKISYDYKALKHALNSFDIILNGVDFDVNLANYLLNAGDKNLGKTQLCAAYNLDEKFDGVNLIYLKQYLIDDLNASEVNKLYFEVEFPLIDVLYDMEKSGFKIDLRVLDELSERYTSELKDLTKLIYTMSGEEFNINSPKQLAAILFDKLKLEAWNNKKLSTGIEILEEIEDKHPVVPLLIRYRKIQKLQSTYIEAFRGLLDSDNIIHTVFNQTLTVTGRLSSNEPNLQNIPIRTEEGKHLRRMFVPSSPGGWIVAADYSQIELRLLAHFSNDSNLINAYITGKDIHTQTASEVFGMPFAQVDADMRRSAKAVNFGIIYGISEFGLSKNIGCTQKEARDYIKTYFNKYPTVKSYMDNNVALAKKQGFVSSFLNRRRKIPEINSPNYMIRQFGERAAMNMPLQGTASDIIKIAMVKVAKTLKEGNFKSKLILQVHDELIIDAASDELNAVITMLKKEMESAVQLNVPLVVDVNAGKNWFECK